MSDPFSGSIHVTGSGNDRELGCRGCGRSLAKLGEPWKQNATMKEVPMQGAGGGAYDSAEHVVLRQFYCPGCGALLDSETAMTGDPFLNDVIKV